MMPLYGDIIPEPTCATASDLLDEIQRLERELAAANATLERLRELVSPNRTIGNATCMKMVDILYPPETPNDDR